MAGYLCSPRSVVFPFLASPFVLFILRQAFAVIPFELDDAARIDGADRLTILWFTEGDSLDAWDEFSGAGERVAATGLGRVELMAPFTPTFPGTNRYVNELRAT